MGSIEPHEDGSCTAIVLSISPRVEPMRIEHRTTSEARRWVETQAKTLLVLEGHEVDEAFA